MEEVAGWRYYQGEFLYAVCWFFFFPVLLRSNGYWRRILQDSLCMHRWGLSLFTVTLTSPFPPSLWWYLEKIFKCISFSLCKHFVLGLICFIFYQFHVIKILTDLKLRWLTKRCFSVLICRYINSVQGMLYAYPVHDCVSPVLMKCCHAAIVYYSNLVSTKWPIICILQFSFSNHPSGD